MFNFKVNRPYLDNDSVEEEVLTWNWYKTQELTKEIKVYNLHMQHFNDNSLQSTLMILHIISIMDS